MPGVDRRGQRWAQPRHGQPTTDTSGHRDRCIIDASGVSETRPPGRQRHRIGCIHDGGIDAGEPGGGKPPRRVSGRPRRRERGQRCEAPCRAGQRQRRHSCGHCRTAQCAGNGAAGDAPMRSMVQRRVTGTRNATVNGERQRDPGSLSGAGSARARREARARYRRCRARGVRTGKRTVPPPQRRHGPRGAAVRPRAPGCRAGARGRRGSR